MKIRRVKEEKEKDIRGNGEMSEGRNGKNECRIGEENMEIEGKRNKGKKEVREVRKVRKQIGGKEGRKE